MARKASKTPEARTESRPFPLVEIGVADITVGRRHRKDMGDLVGLARSIEQLGLLHPVAVTPDNELVTGERRLRAVRDVLGWKTVPAFLVSIPPVVAEHDENEVRKDFTASERVEIARAVRSLLGDRQGQRTDQKEGEDGKTPLDSSETDANQLVDIYPQVDPGEKTRETVARIAGFGSDYTLRQAEQVVAKGTPALVEAMDSEALSISAAAEVSRLTPQEQQEVVAEVEAGEKPRKAIRKVGGQKKEQAQEAPKPAAPLTDHIGLPVPESRRAAFETLERFAAIEKLLRQAQRQIGELATEAGGEALRRRCQLLERKGKQSYRLDRLHMAIHELLSARPHASQCPHCVVENEGRVMPDCRTCDGRGWVTKSAWETVSEDYRQEAIRHAQDGVSGSERDGR